MSVNTGMNSANARRLVPRSSKPSPLVKVPTPIRRKYVMGNPCPMIAGAPLREETGVSIPEKRHQEQHHEIAHRDHDVGKLLAGQKLDARHRGDGEIDNRAEFLFAHDRNRHQSGWNHHQ